MPIDRYKAMPNNLRMKAIERARELLGGTNEMAQALKVKPPTVSEWINGKRPVPAQHCPVIERLTAGAVRCEELNDTVDWAYLRAATGSPAEPAQAAEH